MRVGLVGCVKSKGRKPAPARDLYTSPLFHGRRAWVEKTCGRWFILSAAHGLVRPDAVLGPYDLKLKDAARDERRAWSVRVLDSLQRELGGLCGIEFEIHAGKDYCGYGLLDGLKAQGGLVALPAEGLPIGSQLALYRRGAEMTTRIELLWVKPIETFTFTWPKTTEAFERGWDINAVLGNQLFDVCHGIGGRTVYGRERVHSVTFVNRWAVVEGVAADDYSRTRALVSRLELPGGSAWISTVTSTVEPGTPRRCCTTASAI